MSVWTSLFRRSAGAFSVVALVLLPGTLLARQATSQTPSPARSLVPVASSDAARALFRQALIEQQNVGGPRTLAAADSAVKLDPRFALGRVYQAFSMAGTAEARAEAISNVMSTMGAAPPVELLFTLYLRETAAGRGAAAAPILRMVSEMVPGDPEIAYLYLNTQLAGRSVPEQIAARKEFALEFPAHAAVHNTLAYQIATTDPSAGLVEAGHYVRLAPTHPNAHDTFADILLLLRRPAEALPHALRAVELDPGIVASHMKTGTIRMMLGDVSAARAEFARGAERFSTPANRFNFMQWTMASFATAGDGRSALREMTNSLAIPNLTPALTTQAHERFAALEAFLGDRNAVAGHLTAVTAATPMPVAAHYALKAIVLSRVGQIDEARSAATQYRSMAPANPLGHTVNAYIALMANDVAGAGAALVLTAPNDLLAKALRADLMLRTGLRAEGTALRQEVVASSLKLDGNPPLDFFKLIARMHADKL